MTQPRFHMAQPRVISSHCLYLGKLNPVLCIGDIAQSVDRWNDDLEIVGSNPLYATIFLSTMSASWIGICLNRWIPPIRMIEA